VTAIYAGKIATSALEVTPGALANIVVTPSTASIVAGGSQGFTAAGTDAFGNGALGFGPAWSISGGATCAPASGTSTTCTSAAAGTFTTTARSGAVSGMATLTVTASPPSAAGEAATPGTTAPTRSVLTVTVVAVTSQVTPDATRVAVALIAASSSGGVGPVDPTVAATLDGFGPVVVTTLTERVTPDASRIHVTMIIPATAPSGPRRLTMCVADRDGSAGCTDLTVMLSMPSSMPEPSGASRPGAQPVTDRPPVLTLMAAPASLPSGASSLPLRLVVAADGGLEITKVPVATLDGTTPLNVILGGSEPMGGGRSVIDLGVEIPKGLAPGTHRLAVCISDRAGAVACTSSAFTIEATPGPSGSVLGSQSSPAPAATPGGAGAPELVMPLLPSSSTPPWGVLAVISTALAFAGSLARPSWPGRTPRGRQHPPITAARVIGRRLDGSPRPEA
jgi:hypothetical protein